MDNTIPKRILAISKDNYSTNNGGHVVTQRNLAFLRKVFNESNVDLITIGKANFKSRIGNFLFNSSYGDLSNYKRFFKKGLSSNYLFAFIDGSLEGTIVRELASKGIRTIVFYHNIEYNYYKDLFKTNPSFSSFLMKRYSCRQEYLSTKYSTWRIVLNERDSNELYSIYNTKADMIFPTSFDDSVLRKNDTISQTSIQEPYSLFVGSDFFANVHGLSWYINNVLPYVNVKLVVAGTISETISKTYLDNSKLLCLGYVEDLGSLYKNAAFIVSPIFLGSGLKTKTVEALMYSKSIFGTTESFQGITGDYSKIGALCNSADDFINAINRFDYSSQDYKTNLYSKQIFDNNYSHTTAFHKFCEFLQTNKLI